MSRNCRGEGYIIKRNPLVHWFRFVYNQGTDGSPPNVCSKSMRTRDCLEGDAVKFPLVPDFYFESIHAIDLARLRARGVRLLLADLDNTLVPYGVHTPPPSRCGPGSRRWTRRGSPCFCSPTAASPAGPSDSRRLWVFPTRAMRASPRWGAFSGRWPDGGRAGGDSHCGGPDFYGYLGGNRAGVLTLLVHPIQFGTVFRGLRYGLETPFRAGAGKGSGL